MGKSAKLIIALLVVIVVAGVVVLATRDNDKKDTNTPNSNNNSSNQSENNQPDTENTQTPSTNEEVAITITYTDNGFQLSGTTLKVGQKVKVTNNSSKTMQFASDPHPAHTDNSELNAGRIAAGESKTFTVDKTGTWGFHDHLDPTHSGSLTVQ